MFLINRQWFPCHCCRVLSLCQDYPCVIYRHATGAQLEKFAINESGPINLFIWLIEFKNYLCEHFNSRTKFIKMWEYLLVLPSYTTGHQYNLPCGTSDVSFAVFSCMFFYTFDHWSFAVLLHQSKFIVGKTLMQQVLIDTHKSRA